MPERTAGIKGYVGELIVKEWLKHKYRDSNATIEEQVLPDNVDNRGGPYLDLCVLKNDKIVEIYEVKTQNYEIRDINKSLWYLWGEEKGTHNKYYKKDNGEEAYIGTLV